MARKQILTKDNIEADIKNTLKNPANLSRVERHRSMIPLFVFSGLVIVAMIIFQNYYKLVLLLSLVFIIIYLAIDYIRQKSSIKKVSFDDYEVNTEVVSHIKEEIYSTDYSTPINRKLKEVRVYIMYFENGKSWNVPKDNYTWSKECPMSDKALYQLTHRGDVFIVITRKDTGHIVVAYPSEHFEYKH